MRGKMAEARPNCGRDRLSAGFHVHNLDICGASPNGVVSFIVAVCYRGHGVARHARSASLRATPLSPRAWWDYCLTECRMQAPTRLR
jgi:hypothetical protein